MPCSLRGHDQAKKSLIVSSPGFIDTFDKVEPFFRSKPTAAIAEMLLGLCFVLCAFYWVKRKKKSLMRERHEQGKGFGDFTEGRRF